MLQLGRLGLDLAKVRSPSRLSGGAGRLDLDVWVKADSLAQARALRQQALNLAGNPAEPVIPLVWSDEPGLDGYYRVVDATAELDPGLWQQSQAFPLKVGLEQLPHYSGAFREASSIGADRTGKPGGVTATPWHAVPSAATDYDVPGVTGITYLTRTGPGGTVHFYRDSDLYDGAPSWRLEPADYYDCAPTIRFDGEVVVGTRAPQPSTWQLDNGLLRLTGTASGRIITGISAPNNAGTAWGTEVGLQVGRYGFFGWESWSSPSTINVIANRPEYAALRFTYPLYISTASYAVVIDLALRRGAYYADLVYSSRALINFGVRTNTNTAVTSIGAGEGFYASSDDADGNRFLALTSKANTKDTAVGLMYTTAAYTRADFAIGFERAGSAAADPNRDTDIRDQWFAAQTVAERTVGT